MLLKHYYTLLETLQYSKVVQFSCTPECFAITPQLFSYFAYCLSVSTHNI